MQPAGWPPGALASTRAPSDSLTARFPGDEPFGDLLARPTVIVFVCAINAANGSRLVHPCWSGHRLGRSIQTSEHVVRSAGPDSLPAQRALSDAIIVPTAGATEVPKPLRFGRQHAHLATTTYGDLVADGAGNPSN